jgi:hypothetical protein
MPDYKKLRQIIQSIDSGKYKPANPPDSKELAMQALRAGNATSADSSLIFGLPKQNKVSDYELRNQRITSGKGSKIDSIAAGLLPRATAPNQNINWSKRLAENTYYKLGMKQNRNPQEEEAFQRAKALVRAEKEPGNPPDDLMGNVEDIGKISTILEKGAVDSSVANTLTGTMKSKETAIKQQGINNAVLRKFNFQIKSKDDEIKAFDHVANIYANYMNTIKGQKGKPQSVEELDKYILPLTGLTSQQIIEWQDRINQGGR